jgi:hypothetical protein
MRHSKAFRAAQYRYDHMMPPEPDEGSHTECIECGGYFEFNPNEYMDADEDGAYCDVPTECPNCESGLTPYIGISVAVYDECENRVLYPCTVWTAYDHGEVLGIRYGEGDDLEEFEVNATDLVHGPQLPTVR